MILEKIQGYAATAAASAATLLKVALLSRRPSPATPRHERALVVMGNGPSLRQTIDLHPEWLAAHDLLAVNFAANTPDFLNLRPCLYVMADPHFFEGLESDPNVAWLWETLRATDWKMHLWVPERYRRSAEALLNGNTYIEVRHFNLTPLEGYRWLTRGLADAGMGMPRPRNVLIPAIMTGIREGYSRIYLAGADHTWTQTLSVDHENFVVSIQPHFYEDTESEHSRVRAAYAGLHLHNVLGSMATAFESYWKLADYSASRGVEILNATPGSMIDAFPRFLPDSGNGK